jgi:peroxiredoxin
MALLEEEFTKAVDSLLNKAKVNEIVYTHTVEYLLDGFKKFGFDNVIDYILDNYVIKDNLCLGEQLESALDRRIQQAKNLKIGNKVPDIVISDNSGSLVDLDKIKADRTLILFYASWCPHCQKLLPKILKLYKEQKEKKFEVLAVSIDTLRNDWLNFVEANKLNWLNVSDLKGWVGLAATDYYIYATPTMFIVDAEKKIIGLPKTIEDLKKFEF